MTDYLGESGREGSLPFDQPDGSGDDIESGEAERRKKEAQRAYSQVKDLVGEPGPTDGSQDISEAANHDTESPTGAGASVLDELSDPGGSGVSGHLKSPPSQPVQPGNSSKSGLGAQPGTRPGAHSQVAGSKQSGQPSRQAGSQPGGGPRMQSQQLEALNNELLVKVAELELEKAELVETTRRVQADFENYRKRVIKQEHEAQVKSEQAIIEKILPVLDTIDLAIAHSANPGDPGQGELGVVDSTLVMVAANIGEALEKVGLTRIDPLGEAFDPAIHEAVAYETGGSPGDGPSVQEVSEVMRAGYLFKGRVIRPAMVKVRG